MGNCTVMHEVVLCNYFTVAPGRLSVCRHVINTHPICFMRQPRSQPRQKERLTRRDVVTKDLQALPSRSVRCHGDHSPDVGPDDWGRFISNFMPGLRVDIL